MCKCLYKLLGFKGYADFQTSKIGKNKRAIQRLIHPDKCCNKNANLVSTYVNLAAAILSDSIGAYNYRLFGEQGTGCTHNCKEAKKAIKTITEILKEAELKRSKQENQGRPDDRSDNPYHQTTSSRKSPPQTPPQPETPSPPQTPPPQTSSTSRNQDNETNTRTESEIDNEEEPELIIIDDDDEEEQEATHNDTWNDEQQMKEHTEDKNDEQKVNEGDQDDDRINKEHIPETDDLNQDNNENIDKGQQQHENNTNENVTEKEQKSKIFKRDSFREYIIKIDRHRFKRDKNNKKTIVFAATYGPFNVIRWEKVETLLDEKDAIKKYIYSLKDHKKTTKSFNAILDTIPNILHKLEG